jgi:hypothetical protein
MSIRVTMALAAAIVLSSSIVAAAQTPFYYRGTVGAGTFRSLGDPPSPSDYPAATGGGSVGYNEDVRRDDW